MILFTIIMVVLVSSLFRPRFFWGPRFYRPFFGCGPMMRGPRPMGPRPMHGPMGHGPRRF